MCGHHILDLKADKKPVLTKVLNFFEKQFLHLRYTCSFTREFFSKQEKCSFSKTIFRPLNKKVCLHLTQRSHNKNVF